MAPRPKGEWDGEQHERADVGARRAAERERPAAPHAVRHERPRPDAGRPRERLAQHRVSALEARARDVREPRHEDREVRERQDREERGDEERRPVAASVLAAGVQDRVRDQQRGEQDRAYREPVAHMGARDLSPGQGGEPEPEDPPRQRPGADVARGADERDGGPRDGAGERDRDRDHRRRHGERERQPSHRGGGPGDPLEAEERVAPEPRQRRVERDERAHRRAGGEEREQRRRGGVEPSRLRIGDVGRSGHVEGVPERDVPRAQAASEERQPRRDEREDVGVLVGQQWLEDELPQREQREREDQEGAGQLVRDPPEARGGCCSGLRRRRGGVVARRGRRAHGATSVREPLHGRSTQQRAPSPPSGSPRRSPPKPRTPW